MFWFGERHISANVLVWRAPQPGLASMLTQRRLWPGYSARPTNIASSDIAQGAHRHRLDDARQQCHYGLTNEKKEFNRRNIYLY
jgi:hypothetical protein